MPDNQAFRTKVETIESALDLEDDRSDIVSITAVYIVIKKFNLMRLPC
jgi:hypothetical protein